MIQKAIMDGYSYGYDLKTNVHRYFFVEKFYDTDFKKISRGASMGTRIFDLTEVLSTKSIPDVSEIAEILNNKTWN